MDRSQSHIKNFRWCSPQFKDRVWNKKLKYKVYRELFVNKQNATTWTDVFVCKVYARVSAARYGTRTSTLPHTQSRNRHLQRIVQARHSRGIDRQHLPKVDKDDEEWPGRSHVQRQWNRRVACRIPTVSLITSNDKCCLRLSITILL